MPPSRMFQTTLTSPGIPLKIGSFFEALGGSRWKDLFIRLVTIIGTYNRNLKLFSLFLFFFFSMTQHTQNNIFGDRPLRHAKNLWFVTESGWWCRLHNHNDCSNRKSVPNMGRTVFCTGLFYPRRLDRPQTLYRPALRNRHVRHGSDPHPR